MEPKGSLPRFTNARHLSLKWTRSIQFMPLPIPSLVDAFSCRYPKICGPGSVVGIATGYRLDGPGIESRWGDEIFRTCPDRPWGPPSLLYDGYRVFPRVKSGRDVTRTPHPLLVPLSWKCRAIPLLPLWAVRPLQSLSDCTRVHFTLTFFNPKI
jgi:hypothetical protein